MALLRFLAVGVANTAVGLGSTWALMGLAGLDEAKANAGGYVFGLTCSFLLNRRWTFAHEGAVLPALLRFLLVFGVAYVANLAAVLFAVRGLGVNPYLAQVFGIPPYTALFYLGSRYFAFR